MGAPVFDLAALVEPALEFALLCGLWLLYVSKLKPHETVLGLGAALLAAVADAVVKRQKLAPFRPRWRELALLAWEPWYALTGTAANAVAFGRRLAGLPAGSRAREYAFDAKGVDPENAARRALAVTLLTIPPSSIVVAVEPIDGRILIHQIRPAGIPRLARRLGVSE